MKKILLMGAIALSASFAQAQKNDVQNAIKINPLSLAFATGNVSYERAVSENQSAQLGVFFSGFSLSGLKYSGWGVTPEYRIYFAGQSGALDGVYAAPYLRYQNFKLKDKDMNSETTLSTIGGGAVIGWQNVSKGGFVVNLFAGPGYNSAKFKNDADEDNFDVKGGVSGFGIRTGITLGFAF